MDPRVKTFLKVLLGAVAGSAASVFANPDNFVAFGSIAGILTAAGTLLASYLEKLGSAA
jgi:hypothetical protein